MNPLPALSHNSEIQHDVIERIRLIEKKCTEGTALSRYDVAFYSQHGVNLVVKDGFTAIGVDRETHQPFVETLLVGNPVDALIKAEQMHQDASVHLVFFGYIRGLSYAGV